MTENKPPPEIRQGSGPSSCPNRILDRKIDRHALPQSFSSNLARRGLDPAKKASDGSVRSIVSLFEKSAAASDHQKRPRPILATRASDKASLKSGREDLQYGRACNKSDNISPNGLQETQQQKSGLASSPCTAPSISPSVQVGYHIEDYSLTLLKHKSYFNNRPLARCLDNVSEEDTRTKVQRVKSKKEAGKELAAENKQDKRDGNARSRGNRAILTPSIEVDDLMSKLLTWEVKPVSTQRHEPEVEDQIRDPAEVKRFWSDVRTRLWVDDVETDGEEPSFTEDGNQKAVSVEADEVQASEPSISVRSPSSYSQMQVPEDVPPTRPPPPIPTTPRGRSYSTTSSLSKQHLTAHSLVSLFGPTMDRPAWDEPPPTQLVGLGITIPGCLDFDELLYDDEPETELPTLGECGRPLPIPPTQPNSHSRYPSSGSSRWTRPPTWRAPSSLKSSSPPPVPPLPCSIPAQSETNEHHSHHRRANHVRNRHHPPSSTTTTTASISTPRVAGPEPSSSNKSIHSRRTPEASTSSTTTRSTRADSGSTTDSSLSASARRQARPPRRRRLTTEEKLHEIDTFLSSPDGEGKEGWI
ncbi:hypothetical protein N658DRAFT_465912 [Parathielavia hyrcaniae]|uniref:Uncharacterized protein n=1 Tax=Parathielavia hyrcaniae TaxID=113614 RepID=A0AAN6Q5S5_9PEZI|nr:hypothetical protein N658DRAFT_465912 [Parathielavia hyrcaniae]